MKYVILEKAAYKYLRKIGVPGGKMRYIYADLTEPRARPQGTIPAKELGAKMTREEAQSAWAAWKRRQQWPIPELETKADFDIFGERAFRNQMLREMVEGYLRSDKALEPAEIDRRLYPLIVKKSRTPGAKDLKPRRRTIGELLSEALKPKKSKFKFKYKENKEKTSAEKDFDTIRRWHAK